MRKRRIDEWMNETKYREIYIQQWGLSEMMNMRHVSK